MIQWLMVGYSRQMLRFVATLTAVLFVIAIVQPESAGVLLTMTSAVLAFSLMRGMLAGDIRESRWPVLFQLPGHPTLHYGRMLGTALILGATLILAVATIAFVTANGVERRVISGAAAASLLNFAYLSCLLLAIASLVRQAETEISLMYLAISVYQDVLFGVVNLPAGIRNAVGMLLFPFNPIFSYMRLWAGGSAEILPHYLPHLVIFPMACLAIIANRLRVLNRGE